MVKKINKINIKKLANNIETFINNDPFIHRGWRKLTSGDFSSKIHYLIDNFYQKNAIF